MSKLMGPLPQSGSPMMSSGNPNLDRYLGRALLRLSNKFQVYPGFLFWSSGIARAASRTVVQGTKGTVYFGLRHFNEYMAVGDNGLTVITVCAHEFGHIVQYQTGYSDRLRRNQPSAKLAELHADYLAGFYLADRKREYPDLPVQNVGRTFWTIGDTNFTSPMHHGTPDERVAAIESGYFFGKSGLNTIAQAAEAGAQFVRRFA